MEILKIMIINKDIIPITNIVEIKIMKIEDLIIIPIADIVEDIKKVVEDIIIIVKTNNLYHQRLRIHKLINSQYYLKTYLIKKKLHQLFR